jgi:hypothetical protein
MENIPVTTYRGFSAVSGETTFTQDMADIKNGKHAKLIIKIASLVAQGKVEEANHVKKQLPFRTLTANYRERRLAPSITRYNPVITLDIDDLEERQLEQTRTLINEDPHTLGSFLSPKRHGYKLFVFMQTEYTRRLYDRLRQGEVTYATLEEIHLKLYSAAKEHYEALLGVEVDGSGKDISRGYFMSFDPHAYINAALLEQISPLPARIIPPAKKENSPKKTPVETVHPLPASSAATPQDAKPWEKLIFSQAVTAVKRTTRFRAGNRDNFLFALGNKCYSKGLDEQTAIRLAKNEFGQEYPDVESPLHNAYIYTDKTSEAATKKEEKKPVINQVMSFLEEHYGIRRNLILDRLEFMPYTPSADAGKGYRPMRGKDYNTMFVDLQMAGISCYQNFLRAVIDSNYAKEFNPYTDYLYALPPWDGTDYIAQLADTLTTENRELWQKGFKRWIVGLVACALSDEDMNQLVIILYSEQGKGKSSWIRRLLPPEWKEYFYNGIIDPSNKDDARLLATRIIINMEEFEGVKPGELAALKRIIAQDNVTQRKAYDIEAFTLPPLLLHREHQQPAVPAGHRRKPAFPPHHHHRHRLPHPGEPSRYLRPGARPAERRFQILVRGRGDRTAEQAQRTAPHERPRGGEPLRLLPQTAARGPAGKMAPCQRHTDQAQHIRKGAGEPAHPAGTGAGTGKVRIRHTDQRAGDDRI